jgi:hypothetical protein
VCKACNSSTSRNRPACPAERATSCCSRRASTASTAIRALPDHIAPHPGAPRPSDAR